MGSVTQQQKETKVPWIETPLIRSAALSRAAGCNIYLKLENLQPSGSFKSRGIGNFLLSHLATAAAADDDETRAKLHFYISSGGNAGLGCVHAATTLGCPATVVVPLSTSAYMIGKLRDAGARDVRQHGASWFEANEHLVRDLLPAARARGEMPVYVPPFDAPQVWAGNATMVGEIFAQMERVGVHYPSTEEGRDDGEGRRTRARSVPDAIICSVGGGGLFSGIMEGLDSRPEAAQRTQVVAAETQGAESLALSVEKGALVTLPAITSIATSLGARTVCERAFDYAMQKDRVACVVVSDAEAVRACKLFADDERLLVEPACGASLALCYNGGMRTHVKNFSKDSNVVVVVCGGSNLSLGMMAEYVAKFCPEA
nr:l-serine dehydratase [Quercus suber]